MVRMVICELWVLVKFFSFCFRCGLSEECMMLVWFMIGEVSCGIFRVFVVSGRE